MKFSFYGVLFKGLAQLVEASYSPAPKLSKAVLLKSKSASESPRVLVKMHMLIQ